MMDKISRVMQVMGKAKLCCPCSLHLMVWHWRAS